VDLALLQKRARLLRAVREFFWERGYLETDTPLLAPDLIPEACLEVFETRRLVPRGAGGALESPCWLVPSPEIWMKKLIARHRVSMFQICKCFRNGESEGASHSPEFTMLEYYTMRADADDSLALSEALFAVLRGALDAPPGVPEPPFRILTVDEAFVRWAGFSVLDAAEGGRLREAAAGLGLDCRASPDDASLFDLVFVHAVEPRLRDQGLVALSAYPAFVPCLAKKGADPRTVERWELYCNGLELANCYTEETDPRAVRAFFQSETERKRGALVPHKVDPDYWRVFEGFPPCSGVALGLDRLLMTLSGRSRIDAVLPFG
jgi:lysyl-tRNA synthetase class 2